eukprot:gene23460-28459_t
MKILMQLQKNALVELPLIQHMLSMKLKLVIMHMLTVQQRMGQCHKHVNIFYLHVKLEFNV